MDYQKFLSDIKGINFAPELAEDISNFLSASARAAIEEDIQLLQKRIAKLHKTQQLAQQDEDAIAVLQQQMIRELSELEATKDKLTEDAISLDTLPPNFIPQFASPFRNVKHLQRTLENAPAIIKRFEADFILALLANLLTYLVINHLKILMNRYKTSSSVLQLLMNEPNENKMIVCATKHKI